jgi:putative flippase GtrA
MLNRIFRTFMLQNQKVRFLFIGGINTGFGLALYPLLYFFFQPWGLGYLQILCISQLICISFSYLSNKYFVFQTRGNFQREYIKFFLFHGIYFVLNLLCLPLLVEVAKFNPIVAQLLFSCTVIITSYFWHHHITFKKSRESY